MSITDCDAHFFGGNNMYQCILSDIDGTLLTDDHHMSPKTRDAIKSLDIPFYLSLQEVQKVSIQY